ncbi:hypothetical protein F441_04526 [Phytophthora nicotianae CJ01A1]|uniref:RxLR effector protein n=3 Tax=Phytophthora nicotianae TaxID=4792 RepID=W2NTQ3_PHYNI|nr:hypothetical protein L915_04424 [Phytophthora nicotianae]ETO81026.1 hypothetical protein F444_04581 [Phytophthora nicotianae P1976]ETP22090.1 hypothetical protein F441_04526 [Phytophthora nicotianae CJ01A1]ETL45543.1 hypothetical protein L916_04394 [Phytophthora nicotianae]ETL98713.1 hypothetical protein L917_04262 [Phytophthora nicotianae]
MRSSSILLAAVVILVGGCNTASVVIDSHQVTLSAAFSTDTVQSIPASQPKRNDRRSLRISTTEGKDDEGNGDMNPADEERRIADTLVKQLSKLPSFTKNTGALQKVDDALAQSQKVKNLEQNLMSKLSQNQLAQKNFGQYIDEKWTVDVLKTKLKITKDMAPTSKEYEAFTALLQTRMYVDTLMKVKNPATRTNGETMLAKINENPFAQKYFGQFMDDTLTQAALRTELGITRATSTSSKQYEALILLMQARAWNTMLSKTKGSSLKDNLLGRVEGNPIAQKFFKEFVDEKWSIPTLQSKLGITKGMAPDTTKYEALTGLVQTRMYINGVAKAKTPTMKKTTETLLTKIDDNEFAQKYFGQFVDGSLTTAGLRSKLKLTSSTSKDLKESQAFMLLIQARALSKTLV